MSEKILEIRKKIIKRFRKKRVFKRQNWWRYKRTKQSWVKPDGIHSKTKKYKGSRRTSPSIGFGSPAIIKHLHPSGYEEVLVANIADLAKIDAKTQAARFRRTIGKKKRGEMLKKAEELKIKVFNK